MIVTEGLTRHFDRRVGILTLRLASALFRREAILTRWK